jgi:glycine/D-amino acid oxidase-like deaminating enzyme
MEYEMETIQVPSHVIPLIADVDVLVVGGGMTGVAAALAAARLGAHTMIVEQFNCLGGVATSGGHNELSTYNAWSSERRVLGGVPYELGLEILRNEDGVIQDGDLFFDTEAMKITLDRMVAKEGIDVLYYTLFAGSLVEEDKIWGVVVQNKSGRQAIRAR